jgi:hypothetical protein
LLDLRAAGVRPPVVLPSDELRREDSLIRAKALAAIMPVWTRVDSGKPVIHPTTPAAQTGKSGGAKAERPGADRPAAEARQKRTHEINAVAAAGAMVGAKGAISLRVLD